MKIIVLIILLVALIITIILYLLSVFMDNIKILFGYKKYKYTRILSYGMKDIYMFHKTDENALEYHKDFEFVEQVRPVYKRIKPIN